MATVCLLAQRINASQGLTGSLTGTVKDVQGSMLAGAMVTLTSPALLSSRRTMTTNSLGVLRFDNLPLGEYILDVDKPGYGPSHEEGIVITAGLKLERNILLRETGFVKTVDVSGGTSQLDIHATGFSTPIGTSAFTGLPSRRGSYEPLKAAPGISLTSQSSNLVSAFGAGVDQNLFLIDGSIFSSVSNGVARGDLAVEFIHEMNVQAVGTSVEYGGAQGAIVNIITKQGSDRLLFTTSYYSQPSGLTSQPVPLVSTAHPALGPTRYTRAAYHDVTTTLGGPVIRQRGWFFGGYAYLRDDDSQPGTDPAHPRKLESSKFFGKLTWQLARDWQLNQTFHYEQGVNADRPTATIPFEATTSPHVSMPALTLGHLTGVLSSSAVLDVNVGRMGYSQESWQSQGDRHDPQVSTMDTLSGVVSDGPGQTGSIRQVRWSGKGTLTYYRNKFAGADHEIKTGVALDRGEHSALVVIPTGMRRLTRGSGLIQTITTAPSNAGGRFIASSAFVSDALTFRDRLTVTAGVRFEHSRAISQTVHKLDAYGSDTGDTIPGDGPLFTWNEFSPRVGVALKLTSSGRTILRASYGTFTQGLLTGELSPFHNGQQIQYNQNYLAGQPSGPVFEVNPASLQFDSDIQAPRTDVYSAGFDHELGKRFVLSAVYVEKHGRDFISWTDIGGFYMKSKPTDGTDIDLYVVNDSNARLFVLTNPKGDLLTYNDALTNPDDYSLTYRGLVMAVEKRRSHGWAASGSYTWSRAEGMQPSSGTTAAGAQVGTVGAPPVAFTPPVTFGRDPNDLTNARGRLANDRPQLLRGNGTFDIPRTRLTIAVNFQCATGKPWAATTQQRTTQGNVRILLEPRGSRRLSTQNLLDLRAAYTFNTGRLGRVELQLDVLNALNSQAEEGIASDNLSAGNFGQGSVFVDPRRVMLGVRLNVGR